MAMHPTRLNLNALYQMLRSSSFDRIKGFSPLEVGICSSVVVVRSTISISRFPSCSAITTLPNNPVRCYRFVDRYDISRGNGANFFPAVLTAIYIFAV